MRELIELEEQGWSALATSGDAARKFYASVLREDAVMLFPGGMRIAGRENILQSLGDQPWEAFSIEDAHAIALTASAATLTYKARATRAGSASYAALISSTYVLDRTWQLVIHQQTLAH